MGIIKAFKLGFDYLKYDEDGNVEATQRAVNDVNLDIEAGQFVPDKNVQHTHEGSIGNLCNDEICAYRNQIMSQFGFEQMELAIQNLLK
jgi:hypothetical protein